MSTMSGAPPAAAPAARGPVQARVVRRVDDLAGREDGPHIDEVVANEADAPHARAPAAAEDEPAEADAVAPAVRQEPPRPLPRDRGMAAATHVALDRPRATHAAADADFVRIGHRICFSSSPPRPNHTPVQRPVQLPVTCVFLINGAGTTRQPQRHERSCASYVDVHMWCTCGEAKFRGSGEVVSLVCKFSGGLIKKAL